MDPSQFRKYNIYVKKRLTSIDAEAPRIIESQSPVYHITGLDCCLDYEIKVQVDSVDFGLSAWSDSIMIHTPQLSESAQSEVEQLKKIMVKYSLTLKLW